ncbi:MAG: hypothetical protein A2Y10_04950 [Planctomycetes bacterium GWF2_41_51]|nr:MAG: hypothetical protein A2Y10_04950 [Planctomycetes bacterium GWF2_41_51]HBG25588.1 hypothetical protein [Phycisphaerales bacterium]
MFNKKMLVCATVFLCTFFNIATSETVYLDEAFSVSGQTLTSDPAGKFTLSSGNSNNAHFRETSVGGRSGIFAELQMVGTTGNQTTEIRRAFDLAVNSKVKKYSCNFDIYVDSGWDPENDNRCEIYFTHDNTQMFVWDVRGHGIVVNAKRATDGVWVQKYVQYPQTRPSGWDNIKFVIETGISSATLTVYRNDIQLCQYSGADAIGLPEDSNAQFVNGMSYVIKVKDAGPSNDPKIYLSNLSVKTLEPISYYPKFNNPSTLYVTTWNINDGVIPIEHKYIAMTLAGIMCKQTGTPQLCLRFSWPAWQWEQDLINRAPSMGITVQNVPTFPWGLVSNFKSYISGYVLYNPTSELEVSKAVNLAGMLNAIPCANTPAEIASATSRGLAQVGDVRNMTERDVFEVNPSYWSNIMIGGAGQWSNHWWHPARYDAVARKWFIVNIDANGWTEDRLTFLDTVPNEQPVYGWSTMQNEDLTVGPMTRRGFSIMSPGPINGPVIQLLRPGTAYPYSNLQPKHRTLANITWEDNVHYVCMALSDTGNINYFWRGWPFSTTEWAAPGRNDPNRGWGFTWNRPMGIGADMFAADYNYVSSTSTKWDFFASDCSGYGGYYYPDWYGTNRTASLQSHIARDRDYSDIAQVCGIVMFHEMANLTNFPNEFLNGNSKPLGYVGFKYVPYTSYGGTVNWKPKVYTNEHYIDNVPIVGMDYFVYDRFRPQQCVDALNSKTANDPVDNINDFSYVLINCWTDFGAEGRQFSVGKYIYDNTNSSMRFVTLEEYFLQLRLRLKTRETLSRWFDQLQNKLLEFEAAANKPQEAINHISSARTHINSGKINLNTASTAGPYYGWQGGKYAYQELEKARLCMHSTTETAANTFNLNIPQPVDQMFYLYPYQLSWITNFDTDLKFQLQDRFILKAVRVQESTTSNFSTIAADYTITSLPIHITGNNQYIRIKVQSALTDEWSEIWYNFQR